MSLVITENWSARQFKRGESGHREFIITGASDEDEAIQGLADDSNGVDVDDEFPLDGRLRATEPQASRKGPLVFVVAVDYIKPDQGSVTKDPDNPLDKPILWKWGSGSFSEPTDIDARGNPLLNAARFPLQGLTHDVRFKILTGTRNESTYDVTRSLAYEDFTNSDSVTIPMAGTVEPGQMLCVSIDPAAEYDINSEYVPVVYTFHIWKGRVQDADGKWDSWKHRILNAGTRGWWSDSGTKKPGNFVNDKGVPIDGPVLLGIDGKPLDSSIKVQAGINTAKDPVAVATVVDANLFELGTYADFLKYYRFDYKPFSGLTLF